MRISVNCAQCNTPRLIWPYELKLRKTFFCNRSCLAKFYVKAKFHNLEARKKSGLSRRGAKRTLEQKQKISLATQGRIPWNKGRHLDYMQGEKHPMYGTHPIAWNKGLTKKTDIRVAKYAKSLLNINRPWLYDKNNHNWKGNKVSYSALHSWLARKYGQSTICEHCKKDNLKGKQINWANKTGKYLRERNDWLRLCSKCHKIYDLKRLGKIV